MNDQEAGAAPGAGGPQGDRASGNIVPGIAIVLLLVSGTGVLFYADWRQAHPVPYALEGIETTFKGPAVFPTTPRKARSETDVAPR